MNLKDSLYMQRALELAKLGEGNVSPNPMVGCVITFQDKIIGEGWHQKAGEPHAEVNAVNSLTNKALLREATAYVTLEPCAHFGKTPPCAALLIKHQFKRVVVGCKDPNPLVAGKGLQMMKESGIQVDFGLLEAECLAINKKFFHSISNKKPYVLLKWAQSKDGFVARENFDSKWISSSMSRQLVHKWRAEYDAILVGKNTAKYDDPQLDVRTWTGKNPIRVVIDHQLRLDSALKLFDGSIPTLVFNTLKNDQQGKLEFVCLDQDQFNSQLLNFLHERGVQSLLVEGGAQTINSFIQEGYWNEAAVFEGNVHFEKGIVAPDLPRSFSTEELAIADNRLTIYTNK